MLQVARIRLVLGLGTALAAIAYPPAGEIATNAAIAPLPEEESAAFGDPVSFERMNRIIAICRGC